MSVMDLEFIRAVARRQRQLGIGLVEIVSGGDRIRIEAGTADTAAAPVVPKDGAECLTVRATALGMVVAAEVPPQVGDTVVAGQVLAVLQVGERRQEVLAPCAGRIAGVLAAAGTRADYGMPLFELAPQED